MPRMDGLELLSRLHQFGIFGGSNGYWKTELLHTTRMRGFMLTEDIDSSIRTVADGYRIKTDPLIISRELAPTSLSALWNQRMRWAQARFKSISSSAWGIPVSSATDAGCCGICSCPSPIPNTRTRLRALPSLKNSAANASGKSRRAAEITAPAGC